MHVNLSIHMKCLLQNFISLILVLLKQLSAIFKPLDKQDWCLCYPEFPFVLKIVESSKNFIYYSYSSYYYIIIIILYYFLIVGIITVTILLLFLLLFESLSFTSSISLFIHQYHHHS